MLKTALLVLLFPALCFADVTIIYRKADKKVAAYVYPPHSVEKEIENTVNSQMGGVKDDYAAVSVPEEDFKPGTEPVIQANGKVKFQKSQKAQQREDGRAAALAKLRDLGLTQAEISALFGN